MTKMTKKNKIIALICWLSVVLITSCISSRFEEDPLLLKSFKLVVLIAGAVLFVPIFFNSSKKD